MEDVVYSDYILRNFAQLWGELKTGNSHVAGDEQEAYR